MLILAIIGIVCFSLSLVPGTVIYPVPMGIIGKVYANSMLVLINTRMLLGSEETIITGVRFAAAPANHEDYATEAHEDLSVDPTERTRSKISEPERLFRSNKSIS